MPTLILAFEGFSQSWGSGSKFDNRLTGNFPTKSGIIGMIAAAQGRKRNESVEDLTALQIYIRIDQAGEKFQDLQIMEVDGIKDPYLGRKQYLSDAKFVVGISHPDGVILKEILEALKNPFYPVYLGRRNCIPNGEMVREFSEKDGEEAIRSYPWIAASWYKKKCQGKEIKLPMYGEGWAGKRMIKVNDIPISFDRNNRKYRLRTISELSPCIIKNEVKSDEGLSQPREETIDFFKEAFNVSE